MPRTRLVVQLWDAEMDNLIPTDSSSVNRSCLDWLIDHDWQVGSVLCVLPVVIVFVILLML